MFSSINGCGLFGLNAFMVTSEISISRGQPCFDIVGLPDMAVMESKARIRSALENSDFKMPLSRITVNLSPADIKKTGSIYDLPVLMSILAGQEIINTDLTDACFFGELSLNGELKPARGALSMAICAKENNIKRVFLPKSNAMEASVVKDIEIYGVENIVQLVAHLRGYNQIVRETPYVFNDEVSDKFLDFADVKGQLNAKSALEIAAAGSHNVLLIGPPGAGKSMLSKRIPSILPKMSFDESIETTQIHSVSGIIDAKNPLVTVRPFRDISHTASAVGLIGGGSIPKPGEISIAHNGVLFLDEFPEFDRKVLETLRQPMENGYITISRASGSATYPAQVMLIAAMNPCPCGNFGNPKKKCTCSSKQVQNYLSKISQPVLDRIDIQLEILPVEYNEISSDKKSELSARIRERVQKAREIQTKRFKGTGIKSNAGITSNILHEVCTLEDKAKELLKNAFEKIGLSARAYDRILKVSRTIADLNDSEIITKRHIAHAIQYRSLDRKYWYK